MTMGGEPLHHEPSNVSLLQQNPVALEVFMATRWLQYFKKLQGYNNSISLDFAMNLEGDHSMVRGVPIDFSE